MINRNVDQIIYCYGEYQPIFDEIRQNMPEIQFYEGFPDVKGITDPSFHTLMINDDLQNELLDNLELANLFTKGSHHRSISVIFLQQALFNKGKFSRLCSLNCHYMIVFKSPRDQTVISTLARQMYPGCGQYLIEAYKDDFCPISLPVSHMGHPVSILISQHQISLHLYSLDTSGSSGFNPNFTASDFTSSI